MSRRKKILSPDDPLRDLQRTINRLKTEQTDVTRAKVRGEVLAEWRRVKALVDKEWPAPKRKGKRRKAQTVAAGCRRDGWKLSAISSPLGQAAEFANIRHSKHPTKTGDAYYPPWCQAALGEAQEGRHWPVSSMERTRILTVLFRKYAKNKEARHAMEVREALR